MKSAPADITNDLAQTAVHLQVVGDGERARACHFWVHVAQIKMGPRGSAERLPHDWVDTPSRCRPRKRIFLRIQQPATSSLSLWDDLCGAVTRTHHDSPISFSVAASSLVQSTLVGRMRFECPTQDLSPSLSHDCCNARNRCARRP